MRCPRCNMTLEAKSKGGTDASVCRSCEGVLLSFEALGEISRSALEDVEVQLARGALASPSRCPSCFVRVPSIRLQEGFHIDACSRCQSVWFDRNELRQLDPRILKDLKKGLFELERQQSAAEADERPEPTDLIVGIAEIGMPSREVEVVSWVLLAGIALFSLWAWRDPYVIKLLGLSAEDPFRLFGLTWLTSMFVHAGLAHVFSNAIVLVLFGDNVEHELGSLRFALLLVSGSLVGGAAHVLLDRGVSVGASAGLSAMITYYALAFPQARIGLPLFMRRGFAHRVFWLTMGVRTALGLWLAKEALGAALQLTDHYGEIDHVAHLGGVLAGVMAFGLTRVRS